jgi:hypothetical protein
LTWVEFDGSTRNNFVEGLTTALLMAGWALTESVFSSITGTYGANPSNGQTISAGYQTYTFVTVLTGTPSEVLIGVNLAASLANLVAAVNLGLGSGTVYSSTTPINPIVEASTAGSGVTFNFRFAGSMGNSTPTGFGITTGGGFKVIGQTPQLQAGLSLAQMGSKAWLYDRGLTAGSKDFSNAKALSPDETIATNERTVLVAGGRTFRCVANQSQFFCYVPGTAADPNGSVLAGGTLWVAPPAACAGDVPQEPASLVFWSTGDYDSFLANAQTSPRTVVTGLNAVHYSDTDMAGAQVTTNLGDANGYTSSDAVFNSAITLGDAVHDAAYGGFQLVSLQPPFDYSPSGTSLVDAMRWHGGNGVVGKRMLLEPLAAWAPPGGGTSSSPAQISGQLWNAWIGTDQVPMDTVQQFDDENYYLAFTHQGKFGTLWLEIPGPEPFVLTAVSWVH